MMFCSIRFRLAIILIHTIAVIVTSFWTQNITKWGAWQWSWLFTVRHSWNITQELTIHAINCLLVSKCFSMAPHIRSHRVPCSYFPKKLPLQLSSEQSVGGQGYAAGLKESSTGKVPQLQKFCRHNYWVFAAPRKLKRQLTAENAECCRTWDGSRRPSGEVPARTVTGEPGMPVWTWHALRWVASGVRVIPVRYDYCVTCQWSFVQWCSAQTAACTVECPADCRAAICNNPTGRK